MFNLLSAVLKPDSEILWSEIKKKKTCQSACLKTMCVSLAFIKNLLITKVNHFSLKKENYPTAIQMFQISAVNTEIILSKLTLIYHYINQPVEFEHNASCKWPSLEPVCFLMSQLAFFSAFSPFDPHISTSRERGTMTKRKLGKLANNHTGVLWLKWKQLRNC